MEQHEWAITNFTNSKGISEARIYCIPIIHTLVYNISCVRYIKWFSEDEIEKHHRIVYRLDDEGRKNCEKNNRPKVALEFNCCCCLQFDGSICPSFTTVAICLKTCWFVTWGTWKKVRNCSIYQNYLCWLSTGMKPIMKFYQSDVYF